MTDKLITQEQIRELSEFEERRRQLKKLLSQGKYVKTPKEHTEFKDQFTVPTFQYMNEQMDDLHPRRAIKVVTDIYDSPSSTFMFTVEVTDLETGEVRSGTSVYPMIIYESGSEIKKSPKVIRQLMSNAKKAALSLAIRDAYAHFGVAADLYGMTFGLPMSEEQKERLRELEKKYNELRDKLTDEEKRISLHAWWDTQYSKCSKLSQDVADEVLDTLDNKLTALLNKTKGEA